MADTRAPQMGAILWRDLMVGDADRVREFYEQVVGWKSSPRLLYVIVEDADRSAAACTRLGGRVVAGPRPLSGGRVRVIADPAGAVCALYQPPRA